MSDWIEWVEPFGPNSEPVYMRVTEEVAIATAKANAAKTGHTYDNDEDALLDFMTVHWAIKRGPLKYE